MSNFFIGKVSKRFLWVFFFIFTLFNVNAQTAKTMFEVIPTPHVLSAEQRLMVFKIDKYPNVQQVFYVNVQDFNQFQEGAFIHFTMPDTKSEVKAKIKRAEFHKNGDYVLYATFENYFGEIFLIKEQSIVYGSIVHEDMHYKIYGIDKHVSAILAFDNQHSGECATKGNHIPNPLQPQFGKEDAAKTITPCDNSSINILCLFTDAANNVDPNIQQTANLAVGQLGNALTNSGITNSEVAPTLVGVRRSAFQENPNFIDRDIIDIANDRQANELRNELRADIVVLLTDGNYANNAILGIAGNIPAEQGSAYAIVEAEVATAADRYTFSHEVGHLLGGRHQNDNGGPAYSHGMAFDVRFGLFNWGRKRYHTIMHQLQEGRKRVLHYSNPNVAYQNVATGDDACCNVARRIREIAPIIRQFRSGGNALTANIMGTNYIYQHGSYYWEPNINCGVAPYNTIWEVSFDNGFSYTQAVVNDGRLQINFYPGSSTSRLRFISLRMTVTSSDNQQAVAFHSIVVEIPNSSYYTLRQPNSNTLPNIDKIDIQDVGTPYPNPANTDMAFDLLIQEDTHVKVTIQDVLGREQKVIYQGILGAGYQHLQTNLKEIPNGIYFCNIQTAKTNISKTFLVKH